MQVDKTKLDDYLIKLEKNGPEDMMKLVEKHLDDDAVELICEHIEDFYGIDDDEEIGQLAQIMIAGFVMGREISK
ncbi:MAG: hypothetical protein KC478_05985 [Bacteriovoracaceae bacterium]|nr:hypothetical protein [Bacteriovoracaceae bacterium]